MFRTKQQIAGKKAKVYGQLFETILSNYCLRNCIKFEQIPSGCKWIGKRPIPTKTPFDFIASKNKTVLLFDAKTVNTVSFSKSACTEHQVKSLYGFELSGLTAGYIVWFRPCDSVVFFKASQLMQLLPRSSLKVIDGLLLGSRLSLNLEILFNERK